jgi:hypothetical protein
VNGERKSRCVRVFSHNENAVFVVPGSILSQSSHLKKSEWVWPSHCIKGSIRQCTVTNSSLQTEKFPLWRRKILTSRW